MLGREDNPEAENYIKVINGKWTLAKKEFHEMSLNERNVLAEKIKS